MPVGAAVESRRPDRLPDERVEPLSRCDHVLEMEKEKGERRTENGAYSIPLRDESPLGTALLEFHVAPRIRICRVLPQKQAAVFLVEVVMGRAGRGHGCQIKLQ